MNPWFNKKLKSLTFKFCDWLLALHSDWPKSTIIWPKLVPIKREKMSNKISNFFFIFQREIIFFFSSNYVTVVIINCGCCCCWSINCFSLALYLSQTDARDNAISRWQTLSWYTRAHTQSLSHIIFSLCLSNTKVCLFSVSVSLLNTHSLTY